MSRILQKRKRQMRRKHRVRNKVFGTPAMPRLAVFRSLTHMYGQIVNDETGVTIVSASSMSPEARGEGKGGNCKSARAVGKLLGQKAVAQGIERVVFDRAGYKYHGRVKEVAEGAREAGLKF
jgi:large subunit ribosomal protein L18